MQWNQKMMTGDLSLVEELAELHAQLHDREVKTTVTSVPKGSLSASELTKLHSEHATKVQQLEHSVVEATAAQAALVQQVCTIEKALKKVRISATGSQNRLERTRVRLKKEKQLHTTLRQTVKELHTSMELQSQKIAAQQRQADEHKARETQKSHAIMGLRCKGKVDGKADYDDAHVDEKEDGEDGEDSEDSEGGLTLDSTCKHNPTLRPCTHGYMYTVAFYIWLVYKDEPERYSLVMDAVALVLGLTIEGVKKVHEQRLLCGVKNYITLYTVLCTLVKRKFDGLVYSTEITLEVVLEHVVAFNSFIRPFGYHGLGLNDAIEQSLSNEHRTPICTVIPKKQPKARPTGDVRGQGFAYQGIFGRWAAVRREPGTGCRSQQQQKKKRKKRKRSRSRSSPPSGSMSSSWVAWAYTGIVTTQSTLPVYQQMQLPF
jgi:hypothetical protein